MRSISISLLDSTVKIKYQILNGHGFLFEDILIGNIYQRLLSECILWRKVLTLMLNIPRYKSQISVFGVHDVKEWMEVEARSCD